MLEYSFSHPRASLAHIQELHLNYLLCKPDAPEMRIKPWFARSGGKVAYTLLVQANPLHVDQLNLDFEDASGSYPNEYVSWSDWTTLNPDKKVTLIEAHNEHFEEYKLRIVTGFTDNDNVLMGVIPRDENTPDYSTLTINEFILQKYKMDNPPESVFWQISPTILRTRLFLVNKQMVKAAEAILHINQVDLIDHMLVDAGRASFLNYRNRLEASLNPTTSSTADTRSTKRARQTSPPPAPNHPLHRNSNMIRVRTKARQPSRMMQWQTILSLESSYRKCIKFRKIKSRSGHIYK
jgi:hypothetical protein